MDATAIHTWADMERSHYVPKPVRKSRFFPVARPTVYYGEFIPEFIIDCSNLT